MRSLTLEMSLKPFARSRFENPEAVCGTILRQWQPLIRQAETVSFLLWTGNGDEILRYRGSLEDEIVWSSEIGSASNQPTEEDLRRDPETRWILFPRPFMNPPPRLTYATLKQIVQAIKQVGRQVLGVPVQVGTIFDPGPEFVESPFVRRHPEICLASICSNGRNSVSCMARLEADSEPYVAFPQGIPSGLLFGVFLGRQIRCLFRHLGVDFLWLSNGFGFGNHPWSYTGQVFDGRTFNAKGISETAEANLEFWTFLHREASCPIRVRGTNMSTGIDLASDAIPIGRIYDSGTLSEPPVNSPWAALNKDIGLELAGWMSHIARLPADTYSFRFYAHDPWYPTAPWTRLYERCPYDVFLPLSVSRCNATGGVEPPSGLNIFAVNDEKGELPEQIPLGLIPHIAEALDHLPDGPGPLVWVYPFDEYQDWLFSKSGRIGEAMFGDVLIRNAINMGLPLNTVVSTADFCACQAAGNDNLAGRILLTPVPSPGSAWEKMLLDHVDHGGKALVYGPIAGAGDRLVSCLGLATGTPLEGELQLHPGEKLASDSLFTSPITIRHQSVFSGGGIAETGGRSVLLEIRKNEQLRTYAAETDYGQGKIVWFRGSVGNDPARDFNVFSPKNTDYAEKNVFRSERLLSTLLQRFGWCFGWNTASPDTPGPVLTVSRNRNGFFFSGMNHDTRVEHRFQMPWGCPALTGCDFRLQDAQAVYRFDRWWHRECRIFVDQQEGCVSCREKNASWFHGYSRWFILTGLQNAKLVLFPEPGSESKVVVRSNPDSPQGGETVASELTLQNGHAVCRTLDRVTGTAIVYW
jgi:hypothetical protein